MAINKKTFYVGEEIRIWGKITPVPYTKNIQLVRQYHCPRTGGYWWEVDLWTVCDEYGNYEFKFPAYVKEESYCGVPKGGTQRWLYMVRAQLYKGEPPVTVESGYWDVINMGAPPGTLRVFAFADSERVMAEFVVDSEGPYVTPYVLTLKPGTYKVTCTYMGQTQEKEVVIESDKTTDVTFYFTKVPGVLEVHAFADGTEVNASVSIVGVGTYVTPFSIELPEGDYELSATYYDQSVTTTVTVKAGETTRVDLKFTLPPGVLEVHAYYDGAEVRAYVTVDTVTYFWTPATVQLKPGTYTVKATYMEQTQSEVVSIESGKTTRVDFHFLRPRARVTIKAAEGGTTEPAPGTYEFYVGDTVRITAVPYTGYVFDYWLVDDVAMYENPITVAVEKDLTITAYFKEIPPPPPPEVPPPEVPPPPEVVPPPPPPEVGRKLVLMGAVGLISIALTEYFFRGKK